MTASGNQNSSTYTVTPEMRYVVDKVTYGGQNVTLTNNTYTVAASAVFGKEFPVTFKAITELYTYTRRYLVNFKGGTKIANGVQSADGNTSIILNNALYYNDSTVNTEEGYYLWAAAGKDASGKELSPQPRLYIDFKKGSHKTASNRSYSLVIGVSNDDGTASYGICTTQWNGTTTDVYTLKGLFMSLFCVFCYAFMCFIIFEIKWID